MQVTLQSFLWSKKVQSEGRGAELQAAIEQFKADYISPPAEIGLDQVWAARSELARLSKTNAHPDAIKSSIQDIRIGRVPDRGGRVDQASGASSHEIKGAAGDARRATSYGGAGCALLLHILHTRHLPIL